MAGWPEIRDTLFVLIDHSTSRFRLPTGAYLPMDYPSGELAVNLVCSSLRQRPTLASTATQLLQYDGRRWRETNLATHDIALSIPDPRTGSHDVFRLLLLSPEDIDSPRTLARIQQLHHHSHGSNAALLFLLHHPEGTQAAMKPFMDLHIQLTTHRLTLPIIPIASPESDPNALIITLQAFQSSLAASLAAQHPHRPVDAARDLLPYCTVTGARAGASDSEATNTGPNPSPYISGSGSGSAGTPTGGTHTFRGNTAHPSGSGGFSGGGNTCTSGSLSLSHGGKNGVSNTPPALSNRAVEALSQRWFSFGALLGELGTEEGRRVVRDVVGAWEGDGVVAFWGDEFEVAEG